QVVDAGRRDDERIDCIGVERLRERIGLFYDVEVDRDALPAIEVNVVTKPELPVPIDRNSLALRGPGDFRAADGAVVDLATRALDEPPGRFRQFLRTRNYPDDCTGIEEELHCLSGLNISQASSGISGSVRSPCILTV